ncbi:DUF1329 domain-containing protein [Pseudoduganella namucuonensis]|uniref:DUF1329 domain-containing protein n=1 Tax=Pseudoduganella namucuonensis TaxID=1035707 RepID=A0A1I7LHW0_9BURK|nr:DUF1329 domain-containing protein [Pseudoduganella namucuonensis]SFV09256.1 Protein of unknown function [Pseudoduganella namucuonensis]
MQRHLIPAMAALAALAAALPGHAAVTPEEAAKLKTELTPLGGEKAGNKDGTIPAWTGGHLTPIPGDKPGGRRGDPFKDEKPLYTVTAKNADQYAAVLTDGTKAMLKKYPAYRLDVYPTHRTAAAPQWVYDNTFKNATRAKLVSDAVTGAYGGVPFPVPKTGAEVIWNHILRWRGTSWQFIVNQYQLTADGKAVLTTSGAADQQMPYYFQDGTPEQFAKSNEFWLVRLINSGPPIRAGEAIIGRTSVDPSKDQAWVYLTGQRRVRKLPNPCCDTPTPATAGVMSFDELETWNGRIDRFDWKLVGKQEMLIPYNGNKLLQPKTDAEVMGPNFLNPDFVRWERHRVWVVEAALRAGQRHQAPKSRYYCDEDSWNCVLADRWDANGQLWKTLWSHTFVAPDLPGTVIGAFGFNDLISGTGFIGNLYNSKSAQYPLKPRFEDSLFTPDAMTGEGAR